jgi:hypothetical protein
LYINSRGSLEYEFDMNVLEYELKNQSRSHERGLLWKIKLIALHKWKLFLKINEIDVKYKIQIWHEVYEYKIWCDVYEYDFKVR